MTHAMTDITQPRDAPWTRYRCPDCGREILMQWPPEFKRVVEAAGDENEIHTGEGRMNICDHKNYRLVCSTPEGDMYECTNQRCLYSWFVENDKPHPLPIDIVPVEFVRFAREHEKELDSLKGGKR